MKWSELHGQEPGFWYIAPFSECASCYELTPLPYPNLPQTDQDQLRTLSESDLLTWPSDEWSLVLGCCECGLVDTVGRPQLLPDVVQHKTSGRFHDSSTFFAVEFPCANTHCKARATIHADSQGRSEQELIELFRSGFYRGTLPCGHALAAVPERLYTARRILERLW
jgi:hypothetical protein